jgi:hypothetical protein
MTRGRAVTIAAFVLAGATSLGVGLFSIGMGGCHSAGGFCSSEFSSELGWALVTGGVLVTAGFAVALLGLTRRVRHLVPAAIVGAVLAVALIVPRLP